MNVTKAILRELVGKNKIAKVLNELSGLLTDSDKLKTVDLLRNQFERNNKAYNHEKVLGKDAFDIEHNRIVTTILDIIHEIDIPNDEKDLTFQQLIVKLYAEYKPKTG